MACCNISVLKIKCPGKKLDLPFDFTEHYNEFTIMNVVKIGRAHV